MLHREGLILGSACESGELFQAVLQKKSSELIEGIARQYDYLEIQPIENNFFMLRNNTAKDKEELRDLNRRIVCLGDELGIPVVATCDVHFLDPADNIFRKILLHSKGYEDVEFQPPLYFRTTDEMLEEFSYLGSEKAYEVVVTNSNAVADRCEELKPYPDGTHAPKIEGAEDELKNRAVSMAHEIYGPVLPETVQARLTKELNSIITNGFASLYLMAERLVKKSVGDGYLVGSRGSVGSSFVATMAGITEVNPLPPHYVCPKCKNSEFDVGKPISSCGVDLPDKLCPVCGTKYRKLGYEIPFEVFLGFHGDKTPDIDLNFSGEYQPIAHQYTETMFGEGHAFRAGTISAVQDKTVYGYVKAYCTEMKKTISKAEIDRLVQGCSGVKRTTGQHPGGIVIVPADMDIMDFTPVQYPADQKDKGTITTHFDFHALDDRLVKLDILGHVDPTALKLLHDLTGLDPRSIPLDDEETMKLYSSAEPLKISLEELNCDVGSLGIPEVGTTFVRQMLKNTRPTTMEELVRIAGLSHGTDVWTNNAETLVLNGTATLSQVICTRDDIMNYIMAHGGEPSMAFKIMEKVRKGKGLSEEQEAYLNSINIPSWFIESCKKIKYMFPRAHAAAYVMMSFRVAFYKVHFPLQFYAVYLSVRADAFDIMLASGGAERVLKSIKTIEQKGDSASENEQKMVTHLEVVYEMNKRGIELLPVDLYRSDSVKFMVEGNAIRPPFSSVSGVGINAAQSIAEVCKNTVFTSIEDFETKTKANSAVVRALREIGCLDELPESSQLSLF
jgi:DNA polymerase-3 subunit alpha (Gram-positive type)